MTDIGGEDEEATTVDESNLTHSTSPLLSNHSSAIAGEAPNLVLAVTQQLPC